MHIPGAYAYKKMHIPGGTGYFEVAQLEAHSSSPSRYSNVAISDTSSDQ